MQYSHEDIGNERAAAERGVTPGRVTRALLVFYVVGMLLNGEHIHRQAQLMPYGVAHDVSVTITRPLAYVSEITHLSAPRNWLEERLDY